MTARRPSTMPSKATIHSRLNHARDFFCVEDTKIDAGVVGEGLAVGDAEGLWVGDGAGAGTGWRVGDRVGSSVGDGAGAGTGWRVGEGLVGERDGCVDGLGVGEVVVPGTGTGGVTAIPIPAYVAYQWERDDEVSVAIPVDVTSLKVRRHPAVIEAPGPEVVPASLDVDRLQVGPVEPPCRDVEVIIAFNPSIDEELVSGREVHVAVEVEVGDGDLRGPPGGAEDGPGEGGGSASVVRSEDDLVAAPGGRYDVEVGVAVEVDDLELLRAVDVDRESDLAEDEGAILTFVPVDRVEGFDGHDDILVLVAVEVCDGDPEAAGVVRDVDRRRIEEGAEVFEPARARDDDVEVAVTVEVADGVAAAGLVAHEELREHGGAARVGELVPGDEGLARGDDVERAVAVDVCGGDRPGTPRSRVGHDDSRERRRVAALVRQQVDAVTSVHDVTNMSMSPSASKSTRNTLYTSPRLCTTLSASNSTSRDSQPPPVVWSDLDRTAAAE
eukprot:CAMPEP_0118915104 /NCGR_PEP_ID=MMETSP1166-20130328/15342_1 /TAXON_ID=1104430 /ORGANISM="Chrysoreinhardia sp, Strain CCMP3193" /LENGTH=497 /DNA_ID=CAMNT_0006854757 /DNA_START=383 /DNA_END=1873 /DNA_ORIENTATION=+